MGIIGLSVSRRAQCRRWEEGKTTGMCLSCDAEQLGNAEAPTRRGDQQVDVTSVPVSHKLSSPAGRVADAPKPLWRRRGAGGEAAFSLPAGREATRRVVGVARRDKVAFAREQRRQPTRAEKRLWNALRNRQLGQKFRRQHPIGDFVLDFYCARAALAIEIDGPAHARQSRSDEWRDAQLKRIGIRVLRLPEEQVNSNLPGVLKAIKCALTGLTPNPSPFRREE